jgi:hypothetical protein
MIPAAAIPFRTVVTALAEDGRTAGMGLSIKNGRIVFFHRWCLWKAVKPRIDRVSRGHCDAK